VCSFRCFGCVGKCDYHAHVTDGCGSNWAKSTPVSQRMGLPTIINFPLNPMAYRPKEFSFSLKLLKGFASSNNSNQTTDYVGSSALCQWNSSTLNMSQYYQYSKDYAGFVGAYEGRTTFFTAALFFCTTNTTILLIRRRNTRNQDHPAHR
jgi:hypothetical protein